MNKIRENKIRGEQNKLNLLKKMTLSLFGETPANSEEMGGAQASDSTQSIGNESQNLNRKQDIFVFCLFTKVFAF